MVVGGCVIKAEFYLTLHNKAEKFIVIVAYSAKLNNQMSFV